MQLIEIVSAHLQMGCEIDSYVRAKTCTVAVAFELQTSDKVFYRVEQKKWS